nr:uncharacterized protein LOC116149989 [Camelus dromedarius]
MAETASSRTNLSLVVTDSWLDLTVMATYSFLYEITGVQASGSMAGCARTHLPQETPGVDAGALPWRAALSNCTPPPGHQHLWNQRTVQSSSAVQLVLWTDRRREGTEPRGHTESPAQRPWQGSYAPGRHILTQEERRWALGIHTMAHVDRTRKGRKSLGHGQSIGRWGAFSRQAETLLVSLRPTPAPPVPRGPARGRRAFLPPSTANTDKPLPGAGQQLVSVPRSLAGPSLAPGEAKAQHRHLQCDPCTACKKGNCIHFICISICSEQYVHFL